MINPSEVGKSGEVVHLRTLESIWIQDKLRTWGRQSHTDGGNGGNMFNQPLASGKVTKMVINEVLRRVKEAGVNRPELKTYLRETLDSKNKSDMAFYSNEEGLSVDGATASVLTNNDYRLFRGVIVDRHCLRKSESRMVNELKTKHSDWPLIVCHRHIDTWPSLIGSTLYAPVCDAFDTDSDRFKLRSGQEST